MYKIHVCNKDLFNKSRVVKNDLLNKVLNTLPVHCNHDTWGYSEVPVSRLFAQGAPLAHLVVGRKRGGVYTPHFLKLESSLLSSEQVKILKQMLQQKADFRAVIAAFGGDIYGF